MKIFIIIVLILIIIWTLISWISIRNIEEPSYEVLSKNNIYEVRLYKPYIIAETTVNGSYKNSMNDGFRNIADYIFGNNTKNEKISMTTPVTEKTSSDSDSEKISMTVPVIDQGDAIERKVSFVMPSKYTLETLPKPNTDFVTLKEIPAKKMAVLQYGWYTNEDKIKNKSDILIKTLKTDGIEIVGEYYSARYNPPFSAPFLLRNEILIEIK